MDGVGGSASTYSYIYIYDLKGGSLGDGWSGRFDLLKRDGSHIGSLHVRPFSPCSAGHFSPGSCFFGWWRSCCVDMFNDVFFLSEHLVLNCAFRVPNRNLRGGWSE